MSGECEKCGQHTLECVCKHYCESSKPKIKWVNVRGRKEHESLLRDPERCKELGLDIEFETMVYLRRWGNWLE